MRILADITANDKIRVSELAEKYAVSTVTIRSDLRALDREGLINRFHGGAVNKLDERLANRLKHNYELKLRIAERAAEMVNDGETIIIESGSTNALLARRLAETKHVTIVTNSFFIADFNSKASNVKFIMLGGDFQVGSQVCTGPLTSLAVQSFYVDKAFFGCDGFSEEGGFTNFDLQRAEVAAAMAKRANRSIVITDSSKFLTRGVAKQIGLADVSCVVTDDGIPGAMRRLLKGSGVELVTVPKE